MLEADTWDDSDIGKKKAKSCQTQIHNSRPHYCPAQNGKYVQYGTVGVFDMEFVRFYNDIYERDARVLNSLNAPFKFHLPTES